jgi:ATP-dependent Clp protease adaptor protein ClpS
VLTQTRTAPQRGTVETPDAQTELEPLYRVIIHNDDVTPMGFVVEVLERIFHLDASEAVHVMYTAHSSGAAYVQTLPRTEAQSRIGKAHFAAGLEGFPLRFTMEPE